MIFLSRICGTRPAHWVDFPVAFQDGEEAASDAKFTFLKSIIAAMWACLVLC
jgi:hypothetical protein